MRTMILAAGRGNRLRPLTDSIPKPLLKVQGTPLIEHHIKHLAKAGFKNIVINHAWLGKKIEDSLGNGEKWGVSIEFSPEPVGAYETAGGIVNALPKLTTTQEQFLVVNADVWTDYPFKKLASIKLNEFNRLAHLVLVPKPHYIKKPDFGLVQNTKNNKVLPQGDLVFSGISVLHKKLFEHLDCKPIRLAKILRQAMSIQQVTGEIHKGTWEDVGTIERLEKLNP